MKGKIDNWKLLIEPDESVTYWDMIQFKDEIYICSKKNLFKLSSEGLPVKIVIDVEDPLGFYRMDCNENQLWTVGNECILKYDGKKWEQFKFPLNDI